MELIPRKVVIMIAAGAFVLGFGLSILAAPYKAVSAGNASLYKINRWTGETVWILGGEERPVHKAIPTQSSNPLIDAIEKNSIKSARLANETQEECIDRLRSSSQDMSYMDAALSCYEPSSRR